MKTYLTLFKYERRSLFPSLSLKRKPDIIGGIFSLLISALVIGIFLFMVSTVAENYVIIRLNMVSDPIARSAELLNVLYFIIIIALTVLCLEKMRKALTSKVGRDIFLRLPVSPRVMFLSKFSALTLWNYVTAIFFILPVNAIFYFVLKPGPEFFINTALVVIFLPMISFFIATLLLLPYAKVISFFSRHYFLMFIAFSGILMLAFLLYSAFLGVMRQMFETGSIKFLFNEKFVNFLQTSLKVVYPANILANLALGIDTLKSIVILAVIAVIAFIVTLILAGVLHKMLFFGASVEKIKRGRRHIMSLPPMLALMKKEFITVFRTPKHLFSYFAIAMATPFMIYSCYTLFETLIVNAIGMTFELALTLIVLLVFSMLTNTFCATNITRDGTSALKAKIFPMRPSSIILAKVFFCSIVSSLSVVLSALLLWYKAGVSMRSAVIAVVIGIIFSFAEILMATRMDLNHARVTQGPAEAEKASNRTIAKTIVFGLVFAVVISFVSLFTSALSGTSLGFLGGMEILESYSYVIPLIIAAFYLILSGFYCFFRLKKAFNKLVR